MTKIVMVSGGFDPLHSGHIEYINSAATLGDMLIVGLNSDEWLTRKKGKPFMEWTERYIILSNLKSVDNVIEFDDWDNSAIDLIKQTIELYPGNQYVFSNGGDRTNINIPELVWYETNKTPNLTFEFGVGGYEKMNSSSKILNNWKTY